VVNLAVDLMSDCKIAAPDLRPGLPSFAGTYRPAMACRHRWSDQDLIDPGGHRPRALSGDKGTVAPPFPGGWTR